MSDANVFRGTTDHHGFVCFCFVFLVPSNEDVLASKVVWMDSSQMLAEVEMDETQ